MATVNTSANRPNPGRDAATQKTRDDKKQAASQKSAQNNRGANNQQGGNAVKTEKPQMAPTPEKNPTNRGNESAKAAQKINTEGPGKALSGAGGGKVNVKA